jgi:hypothetical protein
MILLQTIEDIYFTKEDQRVMAKLLSKVKSQSDVLDTHAAGKMSRSTTPTPFTVLLNPQNFLIQRA